MKWIAFALAPVVLAGGMCAKEDAKSGAATKPPASGFTLVVTSALVGNLEPCGCSPDQRGGVARAAAAVEAIRKEGRPVVLVDGGDRFFPGAAPPSDPLVANQQQLQAAAMADATKAMGYDAVVVTARDAGSPGFFAENAARLPALLDGGGATVPGAKPSVVVNAGGKKVGLLAVGPGENAANVLKNRASALAGEADVKVLFAYVPFEEAKKLLPAAKEAGIQFVVATRADVPETQESGALADAEPALFTVAARGEAILRIDVEASGGSAPFAKVTGAAEREEALAATQQRIDNLRAEVKGMNPLDPGAKMRTDKLLELEARRAKEAASPPPPMPAGSNSFTYAFVPMSPKLPQAGSVKEIVEAFHRDSGKASLDYLQAHPRQCPRAKEGQFAFAGQAACIDCHEEAEAFWKTTPHAKAYQSLVDRGRQNDVACIGCHVMGYEKPGGACSIADVKGRENVQCESCHGPGSLHAEEGKRGNIALKVPENVCKTCHDPENSPHFNDRTYRPQILGPGHGQPVAGNDKQKKP